MYFDNRLTDDDLQRAHDICPSPPPAMLMAGSFCALLEATDLYTQEAVHSVTSGMLNPTDREKVILGLYYRSIGFCRSAIQLKSVIHQQSLTSAERLVIELYVDMELVHRDAIPDAVAKVIAFGDWQKLKAHAGSISSSPKTPPLIHNHPRRRRTVRSSRTNNSALCNWLRSSGAPKLNRSTGAG